MSAKMKEIADLSSIRPGRFKGETEFFLGHGYKVDIVTAGDFQLFIDDQEIGPAKADQRFITVMARGDVMKVKTKGDFFISHEPLYPRNHTPDQTPVEVPLIDGEYSLDAQIMEAVRKEIQRQDEEKGGEYESFEEANDFDVGDEGLPPLTPYEEHEMDEDFLPASPDPSETEKTPQIDSQSVQSESKLQTNPDEPSEQQLDNSESSRPA